MLDMYCIILWNVSEKIVCDYFEVNLQVVVCIYVWCFAFVVCMLYVYCMYVVCMLYVQNMLQKNLA